MPARTITTIACAAAIGLTYSCSSSRSGVGASPAPASDSSIAAVLDAFRDHQVVAVGEVHYSAAEHRWLRQLVTSENFAKTVNDIVIEFGNSRYQALLDRFIAGDSVPSDSLRMVWRNTTQMFVWDSPLYEGLLRTIRDLDRSLPPDRRIRVLAGDPPIDWDSVRTMQDFPHSYGYRDPDTFAILEREVLGRGRKALVIIGDVHLLRRDPSSDFAPGRLDRTSLGDALAQRYPGKAYLVWTVAGNDSLQQMFADQHTNLLVPLQGTALGKRSSHMLLEGSITIFRNVNGKRTPVTLSAAEFPPLEEQVDALLYITGERTSVMAPLATYCDSAYVAELWRRSAILQPVFGPDFGGMLRTLVQDAKKESAASGKPCPAWVPAAP
jgi:hypothetical protein